MSKQEATSEKVDIQSLTLEEKGLDKRYKMDIKLWRKSNRGFPFNIPLDILILFLLGVPLVMSLFTLSIKDTHLWKVFLLTVGLSIIAFMVTDKFIGIFKQNMIKANLYGKDLNKAGEKDDKPPV